MSELPLADRGAPLRVCHPHPLCGYLEVAGIRTFLWVLFRFGHNTPQTVKKCISPSPTACNLPRAPGERGLGFGSKSSVYRAAGLRPLPNQVAFLWETITGASHSRPPPGRIRREAGCGDWESESPARSPNPPPHPSPTGWGRRLSLQEH